MNRLYKWLLLAVATSMLLSIFVIGCGRNNTVAKVNKRTITHDEYVNRLELTQVPGPKEGQQIDAGAYVLQRLIDEELILELAESKGVKPTDEQIDKRIAAAKKKNKNLTKLMEEKGITSDQFKQMVAIQQAVFNLQTRGVKVEEKEVKDFYDSNKKTHYTIPEQFQVAVISVGSKADADKAIGMLKNGVQFATVVSMLSKDPFAKNGGMFPVPIVKENMGDAAIEKCKPYIFKTAVNKYTQPIQVSGNNYSIFQVLKHDPETAVPFDDVKDDILEQIMIKKGTERKNDVSGDLERFRANAKIDISIERYKKQLLQTGGEESPAGQTH